MFYWVIYDISENRVRSRVASKCKDYGLKRVQKSAFLGEMSKNKIDMLGIEIKDTLKSQNDLVYILPSCKSCFGEKIIEGELDIEKIRKRDFMIISG